MDNSDLLNKVHKRVVDQLLNKQGNQDRNGSVKAIIEKDQNLRKAIADFYVSLNDLKDPKVAIDMLAEHVAMLLEMINHLKSG